ncbi:alpha/beta hydrolase [soil metagenome]
MLHPEARALLDLMTERGMPPTHTLSPAEARNLYRDRRTFTQPDPVAMADVVDLAADGPHGPIPLRLYKPLPERSRGAADALPVLVYFHGGGWVIGDLDTHDTLCRDLADGTGCAVVAVDYRMGPEHRFPAAVDDAFAALRWVHAHAGRLGLDAGRIAVGGDSAGGNLAAVMALMARDHDRAGAALRVMFQLLIYPATDMRRGQPSHTTNGQGYMLTSDTMAYFHDHYIADPQQDTDWRASPLLAPDLSGLPRALVITAGYDPLRDEGLDYADALSRAGNVASHVCFERQIHGFVPMGRVLTEARTAVALCCAELQRAFAAAG